MPNLLANLLANRRQIPHGQKTHQPGFSLSMLARDQLRQSALSPQRCVSRFSDVLSIRRAQRSRGRLSIDIALLEGCKNSESFNTEAKDRSVFW